MQVVAQVLRLRKNAKLPVYSYTNDLAADLYASVSKVVRPGAIALIPTGIAVELPAGYGAKVEDRSSLALRGLVTLGGVIDPGYRGEIKIIASNISRHSVSIKEGSRIAQLRVVKWIPVKFSEVHRLSSSRRGTAGYGSTGMR
jgi:dUTP pyrophosphatase